MAFGDFAAGMGNTAIGMQQGEMVRNQIRAQNQQAEQHASMIRQQQEIEAFNRQARQNVGDATRDMQFNPGQLPQVAGAGQYAPEAPEGQPAVKPSVTGAVDSGDKYAVERAQYERLLKGSKDKLNALQSPGATPGQYQNQAHADKYQQDIRDTQDQITGYQTGVDLYTAQGGDRAVPAIAGKGSASYAKGKAAADKATNDMYTPMFAAAGKKYGVDPNLLMRLAKTESSMNPKAVNRADGSGGSYGLMQINGQHFNGKLTPEQMMDPATNIDYGARIFADALNRAGGDVTKAIHLYKGAVTPQGQQSVAGAVQQITGGQQAPQQQQGQPPAPQQTAPQQTAPGPVQMFSGPDIDQTMARAQQQYNMLQMQLRNTFDHNQKMQIADKMQSLQFEVQDAQLQKLSHVALQDDNALNQMVGLFTRGTGAMGVQHLPDGSVQLVRPDGQPISGVMSRQELAYNLYNGLSDSQRRKNAEIANVRALEQAKAGGKAAGEDPYNQALEARKGQNSLNVARTYANADMLKADMANATKMMEVGSPVSLPDGSVVMKMPGGVQFVRPPVETVMPNGKKMMSQPQPEFVPHAAAAATARQAGMPVITGGAIFGGG